MRYLAISSSSDTKFKNGIAPWRGRFYDLHDALEKAQDVANKLQCRVKIEDSELKSVCRVVFPKVKI